MKPSSGGLPPGDLVAAGAVLIPSVRIGYESWSNQIPTSPLASEASFHAVGRATVPISSSCTPLYPTSLQRECLSRCLSTIWQMLWNFSFQ